MNKKLIALAIAAILTGALLGPVYATSAYLEPVVKATVKDPNAKITVMKEFHNGVVCGKVQFSDGTVNSFAHIGNGTVFLKEVVQRQINEFVKQLPGSPIAAQLSEDIILREKVLKQYQSLCGNKW